MISPSFNLTATERVLPKLALDFTTANLDSRITFTRALNTATRINSSGLVETVNADIPRFDYDPVTKVCKGLLIEETRQNLIQYSSDFANAYWSQKSNVNLTSGINDPSGGTGAYTLTATADNGTIQTSFTGTSGVNFTSSIWIRRRTGTGGVSLRTATTNTSLVNVTNEWTRVTYTRASDSTTIRMGIVLLVSGDAVDIWGAQLEQASFATSYIPNTANTQNTRNADVATMTGTNFSDWFNASEGAFAATVISGNDNSDCRYITASDGTASNLITLIGANTGSTSFNYMLIATAGVTQMQTGGSATYAANTRYAICGTYKTNNCAMTNSSSTTATVDTSVTLPTVDRMYIGSGYAGGTNFFNGWVSKISYWPQRVTNNETVAFSR